MSIKTFELHMCVSWAPYSVVIAMSYGHNKITEL